MHCTRLAFSRDYTVTRWTSWVQLLIAKTVAWLHTYSEQVFTLCAFFVEHLVQQSKFYDWSKDNLWSDVSLTSVRDFVISSSTSSQKGDDTLC